MANLKAYGYIRGPREGRVIEVAASLKVYPKGGMWVLLDSNGRVTLALDASASIYGWAIFPTSWDPTSTHAENGYWTSGDSSHYDRVFVYTDPSTVFAMPIVSGNTFAAARNGELCDITGVSSADGSAQEANLDGTTHTTNVLRVEPGAPVGAQYVYVSNALKQTS